MDDEDRMLWLTEAAWSYVDAYFSLSGRLCFATDEREYTQLRSGNYIQVSQVLENNSITADTHREFQLYVPSFFSTENTKYAGVGPVVCAVNLHMNFLIAFLTTAYSCQLRVAEGVAHDIFLNPRKGYTPFELKIGSCVHRCFTSKSLNDECAKRDWGGLLHFRTTLGTNQGHGGEFTQLENTFVEDRPMLARSNNTTSFAWPNHQSLCEHLFAMIESKNLVTSNALDAYLVALGCSPGANFKKSFFTAYGLGSVQVKVCGFFACLLCIDGTPCEAPKNIGHSRFVPSCFVDCHESGGHTIPCARRKVPALNKRVDVGHCDKHVHIATSQEENCSTSVMVATPVVGTVPIALDDIGVFDKKKHRSQRFGEFLRAWCSIEDNVKTKRDLSANSVVTSINRAALDVGKSMLMPLMPPETTALGSSSLQGKDELMGDEVINSNLNQISFGPWISRMPDCDTFFHQYVLPSPMICARWIDDEEDDAVDVGGSNLEPCTQTGAQRFDTDSLITTLSRTYAIYGCPNAENACCFPLKCSSRKRVSLFCPVDFLVGRGTSVLRSAPQPALLVALRFGMSEGISKADAKVSEFTGLLGLQLLVGVGAEISYVSAVAHTSSLAETTRGQGDEILSESASLLRSETVPEMRRLASRPSYAVHGASLKQKCCTLPHFLADTLPMLAELFFKSSSHYDLAPLSLVAEDTPANAPYSASFAAYNEILFSTSSFIGNTQQIIHSILKGEALRAFDLQRYIALLLSRDPSLRANSISANTSSFSLLDVVSSMSPLFSHFLALIAVAVLAVGGERLGSNTITRTMLALCDHCGELDHVGPAPSAVSLSCDVGCVMIQSTRRYVERGESCTLDELLKTVGSFVTPFIKAKSTSQSEKEREKETTSDDNRLELGMLGSRLNELLSGICDCARLFENALEGLFSQPALDVFSLESRVLSAVESWRMLARVRQSPWINLNILTEDEQSFVVKLAEACAEKSADLIGTISSDTESQSLAGNETPSPSLVWLANAAHKDGMYDRLLLLPHIVNLVKERSERIIQRAFKEEHSNYMQNYSALSENLSDALVKLLDASDAKLGGTSKDDLVKNYMRTLPTYNATRTRRATSSIHKFLHEIQRDTFERMRKVSLQILLRVRNASCLRRAQRPKELSEGGDAPHVSLNRKAEAYTFLNLKEALLHACPRLLAKQIAAGYISLEIPYEAMFTRVSGVSSPFSRMSLAPLEQLSNHDCVASLRYIATESSQVFAFSTIANDIARIERSLDSCELRFQELRALRANKLRRREASGASLPALEDDGLGEDGPENEIRFDSSCVGEEVLSMLRLYCSSVDGLLEFLTRGVVAHVREHARATKQKRSRAECENDTESVERELNTHARRLVRTQREQRDMLTIIRDEEIERVMSRASVCEQNSDHENSSTRRSVRRKGLYSSELLLVAFDTARLLKRQACELGVFLLEL